MTLAADKLHIGERLRDVTVALRPGRITAICGPNGAGKSTLLGALAGLIEPRSGAVTLDGMDIARLQRRDRARSIGYLPQDGETAWDISVDALVRLGRMPHGDQGDTQVVQALAAVDLGAFAGRPVSKLSGGEKARALLARVLVGEPQWILADEPLAALDLGHQLALLAQLRRSADAGVGVVLVVHDLALAMNHADNVVVLDRGQLHVAGTPETALAEKVIADVWQVRAHWLGEPGARALVAGR